MGWNGVWRCIPISYTFLSYKIKHYLQYFCNFNDSEKKVHENFLQQGCYPIVPTDGQSSALVQWVGFVRGGGQNWALRSFCHIVYGASSRSLITTRNFMSIHHSRFWINAHLGQRPDLLAVSGHFSLRL